MHQENSKSKRFGLSVCLLGLAPILQGGCIPIQGTQFREAALPAIETGMSSILNGILDGVFASIEVENDQSGTNAS